jgi:hypothetical protein
MELRELIQETKAKFPILKVADLLGINTKFERTPSGDFWRGNCPFCNERSFRITPDKGLWGCFKCKDKGAPVCRGDQLQLIQSVKRLKNVKEACEWLIGTVGGTERRTARQPVPPTASPELQPDHPDVEAMGFDPSEAARIGIGYSAKEGAVLIPLRLSDGFLVGYIAAQEIIPLDFRFPDPEQPPIPDPKVVHFPKKTA